MLHAHVSEEIKSFSKHLFATFLGLLMALALEQWSEHRREHRLAQGFLQSIKADLVKDLGAVRTLEVTFRQCEEHDKAAIAMVEAVLDAKRKGVKPPTILREGPYRADFQFTSSAWEAAKASGALRQMPPALLQELSELFSVMKRLEDLQDRLLSSRQLEGFHANFGEDWNTLDTESQQGIRDSLRFIKGTNNNWSRACRGMIPELEKGITAVEHALQH